MTESTKHTPGPWHWYGDKGLEAIDETVLCGDCGRKSCGRTRLYVTQANRDLIEAAPQLLESLEQMFLSLPHRRDWLNPALEAKALAAIKAAKFGAA